MMQTRARLSVVQGGHSPKPYAKRHKGEAEQIVCRTCEIQTGIATSTAIEVVTSPMERAGKVVGGTKRLQCVPCLARGEITYLT